MNLDRDAVHRPLHSAEIMANALNDGGDRPLLQILGGATLSATEFRDAVSRYAQAFQAMGVVKGSRIAMLSRNRPECLYVTLALQTLAAIYVPLHPLSGLGDHAHALRDADVTILVFEPGKFGPRVAELVAEMPGLRLLAFGNGGIGDDLCAMAERFAPAQLACTPVGDHEIGRLGYSGGTTGKPKAIPGNHLSGTVCGQIMQAQWEWPSVPRILTCAPLSHAGAAMIAPAILRGGTLLVLDGFDPEKVMHAIETYQINCMLLVPTMIYALLDCPSLGRFDLSSLETIFYGASSISPSRLREAIRRIGPVFAQFYGQAEAPMCITYMSKSDHDPDDLRRLASCGRPSPYVRVALLDEGGSPVPAGEPGEICVQGPLVMDGYGDPALNDDAFRGGWLHTGDVAIRDPGGFLRIVDRVKDMIVSGGFNIFPRQIEDVIAENQAVSQVAVIGVPHAKWGEAVTAIVVLKLGQIATAEELTEAVRERLGPLQAPKTVAFVDAIPQTPLGKPDKKALRVAFG